MKIFFSKLQVNLSARKALVVLCRLLPGALRPNAVHGSDDLVEAARLLDALEIAVGCIKSFEVQVEVKREWFFQEWSFEDGSRQSELVVFPQPTVERSQSGVTGLPLGRVGE